MTYASNQTLSKMLNHSANRLANIYNAALPRQLIANLQTRVEILHIGDCALPVTINEGESDNTWICSPLTTYWRYAVEEMRRHSHAVWSVPILGLSTIYGYLLKIAQIDHAIAINNWMISTNIYPSLASVPLSPIIASARQRWPEHAIWFRSLNYEHNAEWLGALQEHGFVLIPSRQVYLFEDLVTCIHEHTCLQRDMKLLRSTRLHRIASDDVEPGEYARIAELYKLLYLDKYSTLNPQYTEHFMREWHRAGLLHFHGFKSEDGQLQAIVGIFQQGKTITAPIVGYNTALPQKLGLYRLLMACVFEHALQIGGGVNLSAGAANFKRLRGGKPAIEYSAVLASHMPKKTRLAIAFLNLVTRSIGVPVMKHFKL
jgi:hypothetical protein